MLPQARLLQMLRDPISSGGCERKAAQVSRTPRQQRECQIRSRAANWNTGSFIHTNGGGRESWYSHQGPGPSTVSSHREFTVGGCRQFEKAELKSSRGLIVVQLLTKVKCKVWEASQITLLIDPDEDSRKQWNHNEKHPWGDYVRWGMIG